MERRPPRADTAVQLAARTLPKPPDPEDYEPSQEPGDPRDARRRGVTPRLERILVVDDDPDTARFIQVNLLNHGPFADVVIAGDGQEALERVEDERFDLIITNVVMPKIDGFELVRQLRTRPDTANMPIMILTAKALARDVFLGFGSGADDYMVKPFDPIELLAHVRALLRRGRQRSAHVGP